MKPTAAGAGLEASEGEGRKLAKATAGGVADVGGESAPHSPMSPENSTASPTPSENVATAEKSSQEQNRAAGKGKNSGGKKGGTAARVLLASPQGSDDEGEGKRGEGGGGGGDKGGAAHDDDDDEEEREERMENLELGKYVTVDADRMQKVYHFLPSALNSTDGLGFVRSSEIMLCSKVFAIVSVRFKLNYLTFLAPRKRNNLRRLYYKDFTL
jgi:hypothetical protein